MKRSQVILSVLAGVLVIALFYMLLHQPQRDEIAAVELEIAAELTQQQQLEQEIARLQAVRAEAPEVEAGIVAGAVIVPPQASLPSALRQLQQSAEDSGLVLQSVSTARPEEMLPPLDGLSSIGVNVQLVGSYFQVVDFLRRVEDPAIAARGVLWDGATISRDEHPTLNVSLSGSLFALISTPLPPELEVPDVTDELDAESAEEGVTTDADVDIELEDAS